MMNPFYRLLLTLFVLTGLFSCVKLHKIKVIDEVCIIPTERYNYKTCRSIKVYIDDNKYIIPKEFKTDLATIPRPLWSIFSPVYSGFVAPAIIHDYFYRCNTNISRQFADEIFYSALIENHVSFITAYKFYLASRLFGHHYFVNKKC